MKNLFVILALLYFVIHGFEVKQAKSQIATLDFEHFRPWLEKQNDTVYVINFWATWCLPCVKELPEFEEINKKYSQKKFKMLLVSLDFLKFKESRLIPFVAEKKLKAEVVLLHAPDANAWIDRVNDNWSGAIPATIIYKGNERVFHEGSYSYNDLDQVVKSLIIP